MEYKEKLEKAKVNMDYKERLEKAKELYPTANTDQRYVLECLFPELAENRDERILEIIKHCIESRYLHTSTIKGISQKECFAWLEKQGEPKEYTFKSLPRLLDMIEPSDRAKAYCQKLIDTLAKEGYNTDAKIVGECLKKMNGEDVPMAVMDEQKAINNTDEDIVEAVKDNPISFCC